MGHRKPRGFTLVEILVVVGILGLLLAVLVPVVRQAQLSAQLTAVKAQQQNLSSGLEMFRGDFGYYPSSTPQTNDGVDLDKNNSSFPNNFSSDYVIQGFHRLAFALVGRDKLGCPSKRGSSGATYSLPDPNSNPGPDSLTGWYYSAPLTGYGNAGSFNGTWQDYTGAWTTTNRTDRKKFYINPEGFNIVNDDIALNAGAGVNTYLPVICDKLDKRKGDNLTPTSTITPYKGIGRSVMLYYLANQRGMKSTTSGTITWAEEYYYMLDNPTIVSQNTPPGMPGGGFDGPQRWFNGKIEDPNAKVGSDSMPHNKDGYILISPGPDMLYMTKDDIVNWEK